MIPLEDKIGDATVFVRHGHIEVFRWKSGGWLLRYYSAKNYHQLFLADSQSQRDEYITRIRKYAEIID